LHLLSQVHIAAISGFKEGTANHNYVDTFRHIHIICLCKFYLGACRPHRFKFKLLTDPINITPPHNHAYTQIYLLRTKTVTGLVRSVAAGLSLEQWGRWHAPPACRGYEGLETQGQHGCLLDVCCTALHPVRLCVCECVCESVCVSVCMYVCVYVCERESVCVHA